MFRRSRSILPRIFKALCFHLIGFWRLWLFNYPLTFTLTFPILKSMYLHCNKGVPSLDVSWAYVSNLISICWGNRKLLARQCKVPKLGINGGEGKWFKMFLMFWINYLVTLELPFTYQILYNPPFLTLWASFAPFSFGESEMNLGVRVLLEIFKRREDLAWVFKIFHSIKVCWVRKKILSTKTQTYHLFLKHKSFFPSLQNLFFHWFPWDTLSTMDCKITFSPEPLEWHLIIKWNMFLHDPEWKSNHMKPCSVFQFLVKFSPPAHDFCCSSSLSSLWV